MVPIIGLAAQAPIRGGRLSSNVRPHSPHIFHDGINMQVGTAANSDLVRAAAVWVGYGSRPYPWRDDQAVRETFEPNLAEELLVQLKLAEQDFYRSDAWARAKELSELGSLACADFARLRPEAPQGLSEVLAWCYTYDYK